MKKIMIINDVDILENVNLGDIDTIDVTAIPHMGKSDARILASLFLERGLKILFNDSLQAIDEESEEIFRGVFKLE